MSEQSKPSPPGNSPAKPDSEAAKPAAPPSSSPAAAPAAAAKPPPRKLALDAVFFIAFACLVIGFVCGIVFSVFKIAGGATLMPTSQVPGYDRSLLSEEQLKMAENLEQVVAIAPDNPQAWAQLGDIFYDSNQYNSAIYAYNRYLELEPDNPDIISDLGVMYRGAGQADKALDAFKRVLVVDPVHETAIFNKGVVLYHDFQDKDGALSAWQELAVLNPSFYSPAGKTIAELLAELE